MEFDLRHVDVDPVPNNTVSLEVSGTERSLYAMASTVTMRVVQALVGQAVMLHAAGLSTAGRDGPRARRRFWRR